MATNSTLTPMNMGKGKKKKMKGPPMNVVPKDEARARNFTDKGTPRLNASAKPAGKGEGAMGQRR